MERLRRPEFFVLWGAIALGVTYRLYVSFTDDGIFWPDEIFQSLEPAHRLVFGYGLIPWEFIDGARNWALPGFVALLLKLSSMFGGSEPRAYLAVVHVSFIAIAAGTAWATCALAKSQGASPLAAAAGASTFALGCVPLYFGHRAMSETACALPATLGLWLALRPDATRKWLIWAGSLLGIAVLLRLQCGLFAAGAVCVLGARKQWKPALTLLATLAVWAVLFGLLDKLTWGDWFHSAIKYLEFNFVKNGAKAWGEQPWTHLIVHMFTSMTGLSIAFALSLLVCLRKAPGLALIALVFFALHCWTSHKEMRFVMTALPLFGACVGIAISQFTEQSNILCAVVVFAGLVSLALTRGLTFGDLGQYPERPQASAWDDYGPVNRLMLAAHQHPDLCGLRIDAAHLAWTGGSTYLHLDAPLYMGNVPPQSRYFNYVITRKGSGYPVVAGEGDLELVHIPVEPCAVNSGYSWRLP